jgi:hypothetical protein
MSARADLGATNEAQCTPPKKSFPIPQGCPSHPMRMCFAHREPIATVPQSVVTQVPLYSQADNNGGFSF